jgi:amino acid adenylation domain-containing protein
MHDNDGTVDVGTLNSAFESRVRQTPHAAAVIAGRTHLSYAQLNDMANKLASTLLRYGVALDDRVGIYAERSLESVVAMLAIVKAGGAYVPLDPAYPKQRLAFMREDSSLVAVLTTSDLVGELSGIDEPVIVVDSQSTESCDDLKIAGHASSNLAYVIYTSGSSGQPKGVMVEHRNVLGLVVANSYAPLDAQDCVAHCASPSFDAATWEVWAPLLSGARVVIVPQSVVLDPVALRGMLLEHSVTALWLTVGLFNKYVDVLDEAFASLRYLITGGDALVPSIIARALGRSRRPQHLLNGYGPTETTTFAATYEIETVAANATSIPIGRPIAHTRIYILDEQREPVSSGAVGEIYIGGAGVSRGYLNRPELTAERFIADPFDAAAGGRLYRTGDLGRWRPDGNIEFLGRNDFQVKIRGFRIELGEVEAALQGFPGVGQAVVVAREDAPGSKRLIGYIVVDGQQEGGAAAFMRALDVFLKQSLPPHMIPALIMPLDSLPLTPNGKVDRGSLPPPTALAHLSEDYTEPVSATQETLCGLWQQALRVERVGAHDNFFQLGGDSLLGIEMIGQVGEVFGIEMPFMAVFQYPTVSQLAEFIDNQVGPVAYGQARVSASTHSAAT